MTNYDNDLIQLQQKVALKKQLEAKLNDLREQRKVFDKQVIELRIAHRSEQEDVEKLEERAWPTTSIKSSESWMTSSQRNADRLLLPE